MATAGYIPERVAGPPPWPRKLRGEEASSSTLGDHDWDSSLLDGPPHFSHYLIEAPLNKNQRNGTQGDNAGLGARRTKSTASSLQEGVIGEEKRGNLCKKIPETLIKPERRVATSARGGIRPTPNSSNNSLR
ncbi:unnamed protein product [Spirodela intermedia]|uniref:Uncharacterized protein n=1 Tax=Spirodela intermedia TaxID=51605 RepID=A0A7I8K9B2_SPIIN|nr:unnamed protein product [Spirodela intermedia]